MNAIFIQPGNEQSVPYLTRAAAAAFVVGRIYPIR